MEKYEKLAWLVIKGWYSLDDIKDMLSNEEYILAENVVYQNGGPSACI